MRGRGGPESTLPSQFGLGKVGGVLRAPCMGGPYTEQRRDKRSHNRRSSVPAVMVTVELATNPDPSPNLPITRCRGYSLEMRQQSLAPGFPPRPLQHTG